MKDRLLQFLQTIVIAILALLYLLNRQTWGELLDAANTRANYAEADMRRMKEAAIKNGCAQYNPKTGVFEWRTP